MHNELFENLKKSNEDQKKGIIDAVLRLHRPFLMVNVDKQNYSEFIQTNEYRIQQMDMTAISFECGDLVRKYEWNVALGEFVPK